MLLSFFKKHAFQGLSIDIIQGTLARESGFVCRYSCRLASDSLL